MKSFFILLMCLLYTFVSIGGSIYMHKCSGETSLSIYAKKTHSLCPMCTSPQSEKKSCATGDCNDVEVKIDQLKDQFFLTNNLADVQFSPAILTRFWVLIKAVNYNIFTPVHNNLDYYTYTDSSPPLFIQHSIFRI